VRALTKFVVRVADLAEAEGRSLRRNVRTLAAQIVTLVSAMAITVGGTALLFAGVWLLAERSWGQISACFVVGFLAAAIGGAVAWRQAQELDNE